ncbi:GspE/PulE family protein [Deltaproteobacteria bacterium TL4]
MSKISEEIKLELKVTGEQQLDGKLGVLEWINVALGRAITLEASDVHIECFQYETKVRVRIDGLLHRLPLSLSYDQYAPTISRLKILSNLDIAERRAGQDGHIYATFEDNHWEKRQIDFRISFLPGPFGEDVVLRILDSDKPLIGLENLGFTVEMLECFQTLIHNPEGLILVTGPTGSGKTTTLYASMIEINSEQSKILTVEDPIEYLFPNANQKQVNANMGFSDYARAFLRQDPDIMLVGEIRDEETASIAIRAAQTGHLVLSTVHTIDSVGTINRLKTLGIESPQIADSLLGTLSQRLIRRICSHCKREVKPSDFTHSIFQKYQFSFPTYEGEGCDRCFQTGYRDRIGIYELFLLNQQISDLVSSETPGQQVRQFARKQGMLSLLEDALLKVKFGITTMAEIQRTVPFRILNESPSESLIYNGN